MDFELIKLIWQALNLIILIVLGFLIIIAPLWIFKKVNRIEKRLDNLENKIAKINSNAKS